MSNPPDDWHDDSDGLPARPDALKLPAFSVPNLEGSIVGRRLKWATTSYFRRLVRHLEISEWQSARATQLDLEVDGPHIETTEEHVEHRKELNRRRARFEAKRKFRRAVEPPRYQFAGAAGLGKTQAFVTAYR